MSVKIGKFDIFAVYTYNKGKMQGMEEDEAKVYGYSIAVLGAQAKMGNRKARPAKGETATLKAAAEKKKKGKVSITPEQYDRQIVMKMGDFYKTFSRTIAKLVKKGYSYDDVKKMAQIPPTWGAKIDSDQFMANVGKI